MCLPVLQEDEAARERRFVRALLLAFSASQNRSLFAAKCLVEVVSQAYREGVAVDDVAVRRGWAAAAARQHAPLAFSC